MVHRYPLPISHHLPTPPLQHRLTAAPALPINNRHRIMPYLRVPRGGGAASLLDDSALNFDDSEIDRMVEDLIAGVDDASGSDRDDASDVDVGSEEDAILRDGAVDTDGEDDLDSSHQGKVQEEDDSESEEEATKKNTTSKPAITNPPVQSQSSIPSPQSTSSLPKIDQSPPKPLNTIPTNAYYRFLVRRGPKGHVLASFSLLSIQWIYTYLPFLYKAVASLLLTLRIYDPELLVVRERERMIKEQKRRERTSFSEKIKSKFSSGANKQIQKEADVRATSKLQQLYKATLATSLDWREVRYRYLSVGFRRRHELGGEYVKKQPLKFMGEEVGGGDDLVVDLDEEELEGDVIVEEQIVGEEGQSAVSLPKMQQQQRRKRKITDWVVQAFANQPRPNVLPNGAAKAAAFAAPPTSLWKSIERDNILSAAWESRNAEKSIWAGRKSAKSTNRIASTEKPSSSSTASASRMFASVMTRVGSNGRILGAYPMDAPPIEECSDRRGVLALARRYGYGDWSTKEEEWEESEMEDDSWGGGDLFLDEVDDDDVESSALGDEVLTTSTTKSQTRRQKEQSTGGSREKRKRRKPRET